MIQDLINPYAYAMWLRRSLYRSGVLRSHRMQVPVIAVGNLSMGGSGKTPLTLLIAEFIASTFGMRVAVVLRGYGRQSTGSLVVKSQKGIVAPVALSGDEAMLFARSEHVTLVVCDEDRVRGGSLAEQLGAEVILLDDGFQHLRIARDLNILISTRGAGGVVPFGRNREMGFAANDADLIIEPVAVASRLYNLSTGASHPLDSLRGARLLALSTIAKAERFHQTLRSLGAIVYPLALRDHAYYTDSVLARITGRASSAGLTIVTTTKDAVKLESHARFLDTQEVLVLEHTIEFSNRETLFARITQLLETT